MIAATWNKESLSGEPGDDRTSGLLQEVLFGLHSEAERNWRIMNHEYLAEVVKSYTYSSDAQPVAEAMLHGYFEGAIGEKARGSKDPVNAGRRKNVIQAFSTFVESGLDLVEYPEALDKMVLIGIYRENGILSRQSAFYRYHDIAGQIAFDNEEVFRTSFVTNRVLNGLYSLSSLELVELDDAENEPDEIHEAMLNDEIIRLHAKFGNDVIVEKLELIEAAYANGEGGGFKTREQITEHRSNWPISLIYDKLHPLNERFENEIASKVIAYQAKNWVVDPEMRAKELGRQFLFLFFVMTERC